MAAVIAFLMVFPLLMPYHALAINILLFGLFAVGFNLLFGYTGLLSFGHAAFLGVGSYLTGIAMVHGGWPWWAAVVLGVVSAGVAGLVIGFLAIRTRGIYFSMVTLALGADRLLRLLQGRALDRRRERPARHPGAGGGDRRPAGSTSSTRSPSTT